MIENSRDDGVLDAEYRRHFGSLVRVAVLMTGSSVVAEDLVHDVFVRCVDRLGQVEDPGSYLRAAVVNACRRHHRTARGDLDESFFPAMAEHAAGDAVAVRQALLDMSPRRRAAVVLRFFERMPHDEIAAALACRPATARSLVRRGLNDLKGALNES